MTNTPAEPLVEATKVAVGHFTKAAFEVAAGVGALFVGITKTVRSEDARGEEPDTREHIEIE